MNRRSQALAAVLGKPDGAPALMVMTVPAMTLATALRAL